jgi:hypothetical protein
MKHFKLIFVLPVILLFALISGTPFSACTKNSADTIYITHDSAVFKYDTTTLHDTVYDITSGLVAYYNFNGGNLNDSSGYKNNITFNNATLTADRNGNANNAYLFNGVSSYMEVANSSSLNPNGITLYAIVKVNGFYYGTDHGNFILVKGWDQANGMYMLEFSDFKNATGLPDTTQEAFLGAYGDNSNPGSAAGAANFTGDYLSPGIWYKLAFTYDGVTAKLYINGVLNTSSTISDPFTPNSMNLEIGRNNDPNNTLYPNWFNGAIDEIRIYNRALPQQAITQLASLTN